MNIYFKIIIFPLILIVVSFVSVIVFTFPSFIEHLDFTTKSNIGKTIGGITAPIIGIASSILLFLTLNQQIKSNIILN
jgi:hypothetical protein